MQPMVTLNTELAKIRGIGEKFLKRLAKLDIKTVEDLLWHFPSRYEDFSKIVPISDLQINQTATIQAIVKKVSMRRSWRKNMVIVDANLSQRIKRLIGSVFGQEMSIMFMFFQLFFTLNQRVRGSSPCWRKIRNLRC